MLLGGLTCLQIIGFVLLFIHLTDGAIKHGKDSVSTPPSSSSSSDKEDGDGTSIPGYSRSLDLASKMQLLGWEREHSLPYVIREQEQLAAKMVGLAEVAMVHCKQQQVRQFLLRWIPAQVRWYCACFHELCVV